MLCITRLLSGHFRSPVSPAAAVERGVYPHPQPHPGGGSGMWLRPVAAALWDRPGHTSSGLLSPPGRSPVVNNNGRAAPSPPTSSARSHNLCSSSTSTPAAPRSSPSWRGRDTLPRCSSLLWHRQRDRLVLTTPLGKSRRGAFALRHRLLCLCPPSLGMASALGRTITELHLGGRRRSEAVARATVMESPRESTVLEFSLLYLNNNVHSRSSSSDDKRRPSY